MAEVVLRLENRLDSEHAEPSWAKQVESQIVDLLRSPELGGSRLVETVCRSTVCRVTVQHDSPEVKRGLAAAVTGKPPFDGPVLYVPSDSDATQTTMFVGRQGSSLLDE
jgi:hypothetical protein